MQVTIPKILSLAIALVYVVLSLVNQSAGAASYCCMVLLLPLALIWFPDKLGSMTDYFMKGSYVTAESPPLLLSIVGWFFLVGLPVLFYFLS
jgi:hypothetical protein